jgi:hypothetical protein
MVEIGDVKWSYTVTPIGPVRRESVDRHWANADSADKAREKATAMLANVEYQRMGMTHVEVYGREMFFRGDCWAPVKGGGRDSFTVRPQDMGTEPVWLTAERRCYDTTVMDYYETVHAMRSDGTCQCGNPTRNTR